MSDASDTPRLPPALAAILANAAALGEVRDACDRAYRRGTRQALSFAYDLVERSKGHREALRRLAAAERRAELVPHSPLEVLTMSDDEVKPRHELGCPVCGRAGVTVVRIGPTQHAILCPSTEHWTRIDSQHVDAFCSDFRAASAS